MNVVIIGAGILGLAHAWMAAKRGHKVIVLERTARAEGASIRNFGMVWPIGQPPGEKLRVATRSRELWSEFISASGTFHTPHGSIHLVTQPDEMAVLEEFARLGRELGYQGQLLDRPTALRLSPAARKDTVIGGYFSPSEIGVDPPMALRDLASWLTRAHGVTIRWKTPALDVGDGWVKVASGDQLRADRVIVCGGQDLDTLFPELYREAGIKRCKLQMLATVPQPRGWELGPMIASGLTLRHYDAFSICPSLDAVRARVTRENPALDRFGVHVMAAQHANGEIILGDSHEYGDEITPFDREEIDQLILTELRKFLDFPDWTISRRWHGIYTKHPALMQFTGQPLPRVFAFTAPGGSGMTMGFGMADHFWAENPG